jgi:hypothetical protein
MKLEPGWNAQGHPGGAAVLAGNDDLAGFAYVCCLDCGKELPYSLELMHRRP